MVMYVRNFTSYIGEGWIKEFLSQAKSQTFLSVARKTFSPFVVDRDRTSCTIYHIPYSQSDVTLSLCHPSPSSVYLLKIQPSIRLYSFHKTAITKIYSSFSVI